MVRFGDVALCATCQQRRSTVGKGQRPVALTATPPADLLDCLTAAYQQAADADQALRAAVTRARHNGHSWAAIGSRLGTSRQAAQQRYANPRSRP